MVTGADFIYTPPLITGCDQDWMGRDGAYVWGGSTGGIPGHTLRHRAQPSPLANITPSMGAVEELAVGTGHYSYTTQGELTNIYSYLVHMHSIHATMSV